MGGLTNAPRNTPAGKAKPFDEWASAIVAAVREYIPDIRAVRKGSRTVIIRHGEREARLSMDASSSVCWFTFTSTTIATTMASLYDERRDGFTVNNLARTILMRAREHRSRPDAIDSVGHASLALGPIHGRHCRRMYALLGFNGSGYALRRLGMIRFSNGLS